MRVSHWFIVLLWLGMCVGCAITPPTPSPVPAPIPSPTVAVPTPTGMMLTKITNRKTTADVPACPGAIDMEIPIDFPWAGIEDIRQSTPESNWTYYHCNDSQPMVEAFYRRWMAEPYRWVHTYSEERTNATLDVYFYSTGTSSEPSRWLYLWFLPDASSKQSSYLVSTWWQVAKSC